MENIIGYARILAQIRVKQQVNKPFFGKPYLKYGQCYGIWSYFFQLGCILGVKHSSNLDAFGHAFLGVSGPSGAVKEVFAEVAKRLMTDFMSNVMKFQDYISMEFCRRVHYAGDPFNYFVEHGLDKLPPNSVIELAWQYSENGAALGAIYPHIIRRIFDQTHAVVPKEEWEQMRSAGLSIPPEQDLMSYEETVQGENEAFMDYCRECCPDLHSIFCE